MRWFFLISMLLTACSTAPNRAPVVDKRPTPPKSASVQVAKDWRPQVYTVQKGDTLFGIALEFGLDYKELADWNGISNINRIAAGRELRLTPPQEKAVTKPLAEAAAPEATAPLKSAPQVQGQNLAPAANTSLLKSQPLGLELPYSDQALQQLQPAAQAPQAPVQKTEPIKPEEQPAETGGSWDWPTKGQVVAGFSENANLKGIDIAGKMGQPVFASAPGKVVYTGSGLRGYGKLIIIKHDKTFLSAYAHNSKILVKEGQVVTKGEEIGEMGDSDANQVMLHFEIRRFGKPVDPMNYLKPDLHDQGAHR